MIGIDPGTEHVGVALVTPGAGFTPGPLATIEHMETMVPEQFARYWWTCLFGGSRPFASAAIEDFTLAQGTPNLGRLTVVELLGYVRFTHLAADLPFSLTVISRSERSVALRRCKTDSRIVTAYSGRATRHAKDAAAVAVATILRSNRARAH